jgi:6-phosphogluconolactonase
VTVISVDVLTGKLALLQTVATMGEKDKQPGDAAEILVHPHGRFLYASTRQTSTICLFHIDGRDGTLTKVSDFSTAGRSPVTFAIDPSRRWLIAANQNSNDLALFPIDLPTGRIGELHSKTDLQTPSSLVLYRCPEI